MLRLWWDELRGSRFWAALDELFSDRPAYELSEYLRRWFFEE